MECCGTLELLFRPIGRLKLEGGRFIQSYLNFCPLFQLVHNDMYVSCDGWLKGQKNPRRNNCQSVVQLWKYFAYVPQHSHFFSSAQETLQGCEQHILQTSCFTVSLIVLASLVVSQKTVRKESQYTEISLIHNRFTIFYINTYYT